MCMQACIYSVPQTGLQSQPTLMYLFYLMHLFFSISLLQLFIQCGEQAGWPLHFIPTHRWGRSDAQWRGNLHVCSQVKVKNQTLHSVCTTSNNLMVKHIFLRDTVTDLDSQCFKTNSKFLKLNLQRKEAHITFWNY